MIWRDYLLLVFLGFAAIFVCLTIRQDSVVEPARASVFHFQQCIGGVGLGSVLVPAWNFHDFDPRLQPVAKDILYPVPAGYSYSPDRISMVTLFPER